MLSCPSTSQLLFVDLVLQNTASTDTLACIFFPGSLEEACSYMRKVQAVCNRSMHFYPDCLAICVDNRCRRVICSENITVPVMLDTENEGGQTVPVMREP